MPVDGIALERVCDQPANQACLCFEKSDGNMNFCPWKIILQIWFDAKGKKLSRKNMNLKVLKHTICDLSPSEMVDFSLHNLHTFYLP